MREVGVIHQVKDGNHEIKIHQDPQVTTPGASILWQFYSTVEGIHWAKIKFDDDEAKFFSGRQDKGEGKTNEKVVELNRGHGRTVGTAPNLDATAPDPAADPRKYTVYFYKNDPTKPGEEPVAEEDPEIIICNP